MTAPQQLQSVAALIQMVEEITAMHWEQTAVWGAHVVTGVRFSRTSKHWSCFSRLESSSLPFSYIFNFFWILHVVIPFVDGCLPLFSQFLWFLRDQINNYTLHWSQLLWDVMIRLITWRSRNDRRDACLTGFCLLWKVLDIHFLTQQRRLAFFDDTIKNPQRRNQGHDLEQLQNDGDHVVLLSRIC